jgi:hypothetical protein
MTELSGVPVTRPLADPRGFWAWLAALGRF